VLAVVPACNLVVGNEDGILESEDASSIDPDSGSTPMPGDDAPATTDEEASSIDPDTSVPGDDAVASDALGDAPMVDVSPFDSDRRDAPKSQDASDDRRADADAPGARCDAGVSVCAEGQIGSDMQACGPCNKGMQTRTRTCLAGGCGWSAWSAWSTCSVLTADCMPGQMSSDSQACGPCNTGTQSRTRSCTAACTWGAWGAFGECGNITAECLPDHWRCCGAGKWEWCYVNSCKWTGGCAACNGSCDC
jgi:hypothetical protein